jgi:hypothetical protein
MQRWVDGACIYIEKMADLIRSEAVEQNARLCALKGTYISTVNHIRYKHESGAIRRALQDELLHKLQKVAHESKLLSRCDKALMSVYGFGYSKGLYKAKGYNFVFKTLLARNNNRVG